MSRPEAAVAIVHAVPAQSVLLMRRSEREDDSWSGHWAFPGGRRDPADSDLTCTALRELAEECGIRLRREHLESALHPAVARRRVGNFLPVAPFVFRVDEELPTVLDAREAVESLWVPLATLREPARHRLQPVPGVPPAIWFPAVDLNGVPLWGFTYRLIADWLKLVPRQPECSEPHELLDFLLAHGLTLTHGWEDRGGVKEALVDGTIPVAELLAHAARPHFPRINRLEARPDYVHIVGLAFEEYWIRASARSVSI